MKKRFGNVLHRFDGNRYVNRWWEMIIQREQSDQGLFINGLISWMFERMKKREELFQTLINRFINLEKWDSSKEFIGRFLYGGKRWPTTKIRVRLFLMDLFYLIHPFDPLCIWIEDMICRWMLWDTRLHFWWFPIRTSHRCFMFDLIIQWRFFVIWKNIFWKILPKIQWLLLMILTNWPELELAFPISLDRFYPMARLTHIVSMNFYFDGWLSKIVVEDEVIEIVWNIPDHL